MRHFIMLFLFLPVLLPVLLLSSCGIFESDDDDDPVMGDWQRIAFFEGVPRTNAVAFAIDGRAFVGTGFDGRNRLNDFWEYDQEDNWWIRRAEFPGVSRNGAVGFAINGKGYVGTGYNGNEELRDFWEYDILTDSWREIAPFGGSPRYGAVAFVIDGKGYVGTGHDGNDLKDFWMYDPEVDEWEQVVSLPGNKRINAGAFVIDGIAYVGTGRNSGTYESDFWKYNPQTGHWTRLGALNEDNDAAAIPRANAVTFSMHGKGYITLGDRSGNLYDVWEYNPVSDQWNQFHHFVGASRNGAVGFVLDDFAYVGTGGTGSMRLDDFWAFDPTSEYDEDSN